MFAERLPHAPGYLVFDLAQLCPGKRVVRGGEGPHVPHADGLQHVPGCGVHGHGLRDHPVLPDGGEGVPQQDSGCLAGQALPPAPAPLGTAPDTVTVIDADAPLATDKPLQVTVWPWFWGLA